MNLISLRMGSDPERQPKTGILDEDDRFEVVLESSYEEEYTRALTPHWPNFYLRLRPHVLEEIERKTASQNFMLLGEASLLIIIILISKSAVYEKENIEPYVDLALQHVDRQEKLAENILSGFKLKSKDTELRLSNSRRTQSF